MERLEVSGAVRPIYGSLGVNRLNLVAKEGIVASAMDPVSKSVADPQDRVILASI